MWRGLSCVKVAGRRRKSPQKKKKRAQRPTDHRMHLNWFIKAPTVHPPPPRFSLSRLRPPPPLPRPGSVRHPALPVSLPYRPPATVGRPYGKPQHTAPVLRSLRIHRPRILRPIARTHTGGRMQRVTSYLSHRHPGTEDAARETCSGLKKVPRASDRCPRPITILVLLFSETELWKFDSYRDNQLLGCLRGGRRARIQNRARLEKINRRGYAYLRIVNVCIRKP